MTRLPAPAAGLDDLDLALLHALRADGRAPVRVLAERLRVSEAAVDARLRRLAADGVLTGVRAEVDPGALGRPLLAVVRVRYGPDPLDFTRLAAHFPAVQSGLALAGEADLELHLACVDRRELHAVVHGLRQAGATHVRAELVLRRLTATPGPPAVTATLPAPGAAALPRGATP
ncbi:Lrp/AsnC family transcriptional regulator [Kitasatospora sp. GP82]|uniref:Lrp/AsnC family transcriptional regulator n=1 Tax=Kitasatospora sp. GP82 TaxID=3035089 RepID=UPI002474B4DC|nr:Lrp/AsnC family transcriptional regulator [Kitasatospora sp. GP82]MDH6128786.1 Lrp/AsnC family leucine-responsive transcriptional regulator [Kitasatospora sp. GP82]